MTSLAIHNIPVESIDVPADRARDYDEEAARALAAIIAEQGLLHPIRVRRNGERWRLISGLHRLRAFGINQQTLIPASVAEAGTDDEALLEEVMENLGRHELNALDRCHHLYELKQVWERMYPQAKRGGDKNVQKGRGAKRQTLPFGEDGGEIFGFSKATAEKIGLSERAIRQDVKIWTGLVPTARRRLAGTDLAKKQTELKALSELQATPQLKVIDLILGADHPQIGNVAEALLFLQGGVAMSAEERRYLSIRDGLKALPDASFDRLLADHEDRVIASLKRRGRI